MQSVVLQLEVKWRVGDRLGSHAAVLRVLEAYKLLPVGNWLARLDPSFAHLRPLAAHRCKCIGADEDQRQVSVLKCFGWRIRDSGASYGKEQTR